jgi:hypothetical protein
MHPIFGLVENPACFDSKTRGDFDFAVAKRGYWVPNSDAICRPISVSKP